MDRQYGQDSRVPLKAEARLICLKNVESSREDCFEITGEQGRDGSCIVYQAFLCAQGKRDRPVLLKEFYPLAYADSLRRNRDTCALALTARANLQNSYERARRLFLDACGKQKEFYLSHADASADELVEIQGLYSMGDSNYVMMRAMGGHSWDQLPRESLYAILETILSTLEELALYHGDHYLHGDIKPANIYVFQKTRQHIALLDFGSVQRLENGALTGAETLSYSEAFAALELLNAAGKEGLDRADYYECITPKADLYAVAAVAYFKITGEAPPRGMGERMLRERRRRCLRELWEREKDGWLSRISFHMIEELERFFDTSLAFNPDVRYSNPT